MFGIDRKLNYGRENIRRFFEQIRSYETVVDIGAGHGDDLAIARDVNPNAKMIALENFETYARQLEERSLVVHRVDIERERFPFEPETVDVFVANQVLEHTKEVFWILHEVTRSLKVGGRFLLGVPNLAAFHNRLLLAAGRQPTCIQNNSAHIRGYTKQDVLKLLDSPFPGGYVLEDFKGSNFYPFGPLLAKPLSRAFPSLSWAIFLHLRKARKYEGGFLEYPVTNRLETRFFLGT